MPRPESCQCACQYATHAMQCKEKSVHSAASDPRISLKHSLTGNNEHDTLLQTLEAGQGARGFPGMWHMRVESNTLGVQHSMRSSPMHSTLNPRATTCSTALDGY